jgi:hypothetical protein
VNAVDTDYYFKKWVTFVKMVRTGIIWLTVIIAAIEAVPLPEDYKVGIWPYLIAVVGAVGKGIWNVVKQRHLPGNPLYGKDLGGLERLATALQGMGLCLLLGFSGCATYGYEFVDSDGASMSMHAHALVSKIDESMATADYRWDKDGAGHWAVGGRAENMDSTEALQMLSAIVQLVGQLRAPAAAEEPDPVVLPLPQEGVLYGPPSPWFSGKALQ